MMYLPKAGTSRILFIAFCTLLLEFLVRVGWIDPFIVAAPSKILLGCVQKILSGEFFARARVTGFEIGMSSVITLALGISLGVCLWGLKDVGKVLEPFVMILYSVPTILFYPIFAVLLGIGTAPVICVAVIMGVVPIILNIRAGLSEVESVYINVARSMNATKWQMFFKVSVPAAAPMIFAGIKMGFVFMLVGVLAMEFLIPFDGFGFLVYWGYYTFDTVELYVGITYIILISVGALYLLTLAERKIRRA